MPGVIINDAELAELQSLYPMEQFKGGFTRQQEQFMLYFIKGLNATAAATAAGYTSPSAGSNLLRDERIRAALDFLREKHFQEVHISRDKLNAMLMEAHSHATNTLEEVAAIRELGKMNDLYADAKHRSAKVQVNIGSQVTNVKEISKLSDEQLIAMVGDEIVLDPEDYKLIPNQSEDEPQAPQEGDENG